jgi:hypothetical protein
VDRGNAPSGDGRERVARAIASHDAFDPELATELAIVDAIRSLTSVTGPGEQARARMRARISTELREPEPTKAGHGERGWTASGKTLFGPGLRGRLGVALAAAITMVFLLAGLSTLFAEHALPGDTLYGVKRTAEAASLELTFGEESRARKHLEHAAVRVSEMETLAQRYPTPADAPAGAYRTALSDLDADATAGSRRLIELATRADIGQLEALRTWAEQQRSRLAAVAPHVPLAVHDRRNLSVDMLTKIIERTAVLLGRTHCYQLTIGYSDEVGPLPATGTCGAPDGTGSVPTSPNTLPADPAAVTSADSTIAGSGSEQPTRTPTVSPTAPPVLGATAPPPAVSPSRSVYPPPPPPLLPLLPLPLFELPPLFQSLPGFPVG